MSDATIIQPPGGTAADSDLEILRLATPFREAPEELLRRIAALGRRATYDAGGRIYTAGEEADDIYVTVSGRIEHIFTEEITAQDPLKRMARGGVFGWAGLLLGHTKRLATATAREPSEVIAINTREAGRGARGRSRGGRRGHGPLRRHDPAGVRAPGPAGPGAPAHRPAAHRGDVGPRSHHVPAVALDQQSAAVPHAHRLRSLHELLVPVGRSLEAAALSRDAGHHDGAQGVGVAEPDVRAFLLSPRSTTTTSWSRSGAWRRRSSSPPCSGCRSACS